MLSLIGLAARSQMPTPYVVPNVDWIKYHSQKDLPTGAPTALDANSNVYLTGYIGTSTNANLVVLKYDSTGTQIYPYTYNNGGYDNGKAIRVDAAGNAIVAGVSEDPINGTGEDYVIMKLSPAGSLMWSTPTRFDGGAGNGNDEPNDICVDANGAIYVTGKSRTPNGDNDIVTLKIDGNTGSIMWQHAFDLTNADDEGTAMVLSSNGQRLYVTGYATNSAGNTDFVTYALQTSSGNYDWAPVYFDLGGPDRANAIILSGANIVVTGEMDGSAAGNGTDYLTIKYDGLTGATLWQQPYDGYPGTGANDRATSLARDSTGNIGVVGTALNGNTYEYHTVLYDSTGTQYGLNKESTRLTTSWTDPKICNDTIAHHWYVSGEILRVTKDIHVYQITPSGNTSWRQPIDGQGSDIDMATGVAVNGVGVVYVGALSKNISTDYDFTTIKLNQTPCYWPPDFAAEPVNNGHLYLKNQGQLLRTDTVLANEVLYYTHNTNPRLYIEQNAFDFVFNHEDTVASTLDTLEKIQYSFLGCNPLASMHEYLPRLTSYNYYLGYALSPAITDVKGNERVFIPNYYPYVDLHYFSGAGGIKFYFVVKPGASIREIRMQINGAVSTGIDASTGRLGIAANFGSIQLEQPIAYTVGWTGNVVTIPGQAVWNSMGSNIYSIIPPAYNTAWPLIIQVSQVANSAGAAGTTANLDYSTYYGNNGVSGTATQDWGYDITVDNI